MGFYRVYGLGFDKLFLFFALLFYSCILAHFAHYSFHKSNYSSPCHLLFSLLVLLKKHNKTSLRHSE